MPRPLTPPWHPRRPSPAQAGRLASLLLAALVPLLLCAALCYYASGRIVRREAGNAAMFVANQLRAIVGEAEAAAQGLAPLAGDPCDRLAPGLTLAAAVTPYVRTIDIVEDGRTVCSSVNALRGAPRRVPAGPQPGTRSGAWTTFANSTPMTPGRGALLVGVWAAGGRAVVAIVDDRYLRDLLAAAAPPRMFGRIELRFDDGPALAAAPPGTPPPGVGPVLADLREAIGSGTFHLRIEGLAARRRAALLGLLLRYLPWAAVLSGLLVWRVRREQRNRGSRREQLLRGMRANEFYVEYQPVYGVAQQRCHGAEALLRWSRRDAQGAPVRPDEFIAAAEDEQTIVPLTQHLLKLIARDLAAMKLGPDFELGINFAPEHLASERLLDDLRALREALGAAGPRIVVEITERTLIRNTNQAVRNLVQARSEGAKVAIDDFGTGYCSLSYLERYPFDVLKIERGFVTAIDPGVRRAVVLDAIIDLAHSLGAQIIAEGVETQTQYAWLCARGVGSIQGYLYARPMAADAFRRWYETKGGVAFAPAATASSAQ